MLCSFVCLSPLHTIVGCAASSIAFVPKASVLSCTDVGRAACANGDSSPARGLRADDFDEIQDILGDQALARVQLACL